MSGEAVTRRPIARWAAGAIERVQDPIAVEGPLEIQVDGRALAVTLRTPGHDRDLAVGFLASEAVLKSREDVREVTEHPADCADAPDRVDVTLAPGVAFDWTRLERHFAATAACGLCGRAHLDSLRTGLQPIPPTTPIDPTILAALPSRLREAQAAFTQTGGLHAAALCKGANLQLEVLREDIGRHNAVDKVIGAKFDQGAFPIQDAVLWVSGRAGAEIVLKAARAQIPILAAVGAPSSLAIDLANAAAMTLIGFLRDNRMNIYTHEERLS